MRLVFDKRWPERWTLAFLVNHLLLVIAVIAVVCRYEWKYDGLVHVDHIPEQHGQPATTMPYLGQNDITTVITYIMPVGSVTAFLILCEAWYYARGNMHPVLVLVANIAIWGFWVGALPAIVYWGAGYWYTKATPHWVSQYHALCVANTIPFSPGDTIPWSAADEWQRDVTCAGEKFLLWVVLPFVCLNILIIPCIFILSIKAIRAMRAGRRLGAFDSSEAAAETRPSPTIDNKKSLEAGEKFLGVTTPAVFTGAESELLPPPEAAVPGRASAGASPPTPPPALYVDGVLYHPISA